MIHTLTLCVVCFVWGYLILLLLYIHFTQAIGYGLVLVDGNVVNINRLKKLHIQRIDKLFKVTHKHLLPA